MMDGLFGLFSTKPAAPEVKEPKIRITPNKRNSDGFLHADVYFYWSGAKSGTDVTRKVGYINAPIEVSGYIKTMVNNHAKPNEEAYYKISTSEVNQYIDTILFLDEEPTERDFTLEAEIKKVGENVIVWVKVSDVNVVTTPPADGGKKSKKKKKRSQRTKNYDGKKSQRKKSKKKKKSV
jgi:hypothetical protein